MQNRGSSFSREIILAALGVAAGKASETPIHHDDSSRITPATELRALGVLRLGKGVLLFLTGFELGSFFFEQSFLSIVELDLGKEAYQNEMFLDDVTQFSDDRRHKLAARFPVSAPRIEDSFQLIDQESHVATFAEYGRNNPGQRDNPLVVVKVL